MTPKAFFVRALGVVDKPRLLRAMARRDSSVTADLVFTLSPEDFRALPLSTFAYWLSNSVRDLFKESPQLADIAQTRTGMGTLDDFRFLRLDWEVETEPNGWVPYAKGETYRPFLETFYSRANWREDGKEVKVYVENKVGSASRRIRAQAWYFRPGLTWVRRTHRLCVRVLPEGAIFSGGTQAVFPGGSSPDEVLRRLGPAELALLRLSYEGWCREDGRCRPI